MNSGLCFSHIASLAVLRGNLNSFIALAVGPDSGYKPVTGSGFGALSINALTSSDASPVETLSCQSQKMLVANAWHTDVVVPTKLVPIKNTKLNLERGFVTPHMEQQFLVPLRVERVSNDAGTEDLLAKRNDSERVHVPTGASHCDKDKLYK